MSQYGTGGTGAVEAVLAANPDTVRTVVAESSNHDLTIRRATREMCWQERVFGLLPVAVGERVRNTGVKAKLNLGITSKFRRWFRWE